MDPESQASYTAAEVLPPRIQRLLESDVCLHMEKVLIEGRISFICESNNGHRCAFNSSQALQNYLIGGPYTCRTLKERTSYGKIGRREAEAIKKNGILRTHGALER